QIILPHAIISRLGGEAGEDAINNLGCNLFVMVTCCQSKRVAFKRADDACDQFLPARCVRGGHDSLFSDARRARPSDDSSQSSPATEHSNPADWISFARRQMVNSF